MFVHFTSFLNSHNISHSDTFRPTICRQGSTLEAAAPTVRIPSLLLLPCWREQRAGPSSQGAWLLETQT